LKKNRLIRTLNKLLRGVTLLSGSEVDIKLDGKRIPAEEGIEFRLKKEWISSSETGLQNTKS
jgi:hypothetical protein